MNKELIKKYKAEFDHWLNGGEGILSYCFVFTGEQYQWSAMYDESDVFKERDVPYDIKSIVINDEYVEFRKALAEGKTLQLNDGYKIAPTWGDTYQDKTPLETYPVHCYRIKPEEPKFKVGDWVVEIHSTTKAQVLELFGNQIRVKFCYPDAIITTDSSDFSLWQPKKGDWCWFLNKDRIPTISQFLSIETDGNRKYSATFPNTPHPMIGYYDYCEPFIGNLPSNLKRDSEIYKSNNKIVLR